jgi:hypothetical protein
MGILYQLRLKTADGEAVQLQPALDAMDEIIEFDEFEEG